MDALYEQEGSMSTPLNKKLSNAEEVFQRSIVGILNKRGYNVQDSMYMDVVDTSESSTASITSTSSSMSSILLGLREPKHGQGPLHIAVRKGDIQVLNALLDHECAEEIINLCDDHGNTALHFAAGSCRRTQSLSIVLELLKNGANVHIKNKRQLTPLAAHVLTLNVDKPAVVSTLLEYGSDPNTQLEGESLLRVALRRDFSQVCGVLVSYGASMTALNTAGLMCYEVASPRMKQEMIRNIRLAPSFVPLALRNKCMRCSSPLLTSGKVALNCLKRLFGVRISTHQCNCYHCGLLFCSQCLKHTQVANVLHVSFTRSRMDDLSHVKTCPLCELVFQERVHKRRVRQLCEERTSRRSCGRDSITLGTTIAA